MPRYHSAPVRASRAFVVTPYYVDASDMRPELPARCLHATTAESEPCRLRITFYRVRKTGPCFPLAVLKCLTHKRASTLYPPGHVPYGRVAVAPVDAQGELIRSCQDDGQAPGAAAWETTLFGAALDAAAGALWPKETVRSPAEDGPPAPLDPRRHRTQGRHLSLAAELLGIDPALDSTAREAIARALAVPCLELRQAARDLDGAARYRDEACIIVRILEQMRPARRLGDQLLAAGQRAGLWGAPRRWDPGGRRFQRSGARC